MKVLVTGGAGFIGSALTKRLIADGDDVVVLDSFNEYYDPALKRAREKHFLGDATVIEGDICDRDLIEQIFTEHKFDAVCHLAAQAGVRYSIEHPSEYIRANVLGTQMLLEVMKNHGVKHMVFASSSSVYGVDTPAPFKETEPAVLPVSIYAATKRSGELIAYNYHTQYGTATTALRFFTVYGPWSRPDMAMLKFAEKISAGEAIDIYNQGDLRRDFTYIDDIVAGFVAAIRKPLGFEIINLGNGSPIELMVLVETLEKELGISAEKKMLPMQTGDVYETYADIRKAHDLLGYEPTTKFADGVKSFVNWYQNEYQGR